MNTELRALIFTAQWVSECLQAHVRLHGEVAMELQAEGLGSLQMGARRRQRPVSRLSGRLGPEPLHQYLLSVFSFTPAFAHLACE